MEMLRYEDVTMTSSGADALHILLIRSFDLILIDVMMPRIDEPHLYQTLTFRQPKYMERFILIAGIVNTTGCTVLNKHVNKALC